MRKTLLVILLLAFTLPLLGQTQHGRINAKDIVPRADKDDLGSASLQWEAFLEDSQFFSSFILKQTTADYTILWSDPAAPRTLTIPDTLGSANFLLVPARQAAAATDTFTSQVSGDAALRFSIDADGKQQWGDGTAALDLSLFRFSAGVLKTDGSFVVSGNINTATDDQVLVSNGTLMQNKALPSCSNGTTSKLLYNTTTNAFSCGTDQSNVSDDIFEPTVSFLKDDFINPEPHGSATAPFGLLHWAELDNQGTNTVDGLASEAAADNFNRPGTLKFTTSAGSGDNVVIFVDDNAGDVSNKLVGRISNNTGWESYWIVKTDANISDIRIYVGFNGAYNSVRAASGFWMRYDTNVGFADTTWIFESCNASSCTTADSGVTVATNTWYKFKFTGATATEVTGQVDAAAEDTITADTPNAVDLGPFMLVSNDTTAVKSAWIDYFSYKAIVVR